MPWLESGRGRIHFEDRGAGDPLLLMPGVTDNADDLASLIDALASDYRVIAPDLPGSGRSEPIPRRFPTDFYQEDARSMAALLAELSIERAHVLGFSDGGEIGLLLAIQDARLVRSLLIWGAAGRLFPALASTFDAIYDCLEPNATRWRAFGERVKRRYGEGAARETLHSWVTASRAILAAGGDISFSRCGEIACPTQMLAGDRDAFCPPIPMRELADRIPGADLAVIAGGGHSLHEQRPRWFIETAMTWLARQP